MYGYATQKFALLVNIAKTEVFVNLRLRVYLTKLLIVLVVCSQNCFITLLNVLVIKFVGGL